MKFNRFRLIVCTCVLAVATGLVAFADEEGTNTVLEVWGDNNGAFARAQTAAITSYTKVRVQGNYAFSCDDGTADSGWCVDSGGWFFSGSRAVFRQHIIPCGWITGESVHFSSGTTIASGTKSVYVSCPTPEELCDYSNGYYYNPDIQNCQYSPIIIDTALVPNDAYVLSSPDNGVLFDINADGVLERVAWPVNGQRTAFLALDRDGNGVIDDGSELFGNFTIPGADNGFAALAAIAPHNQDGVIDVRDPLYDQLLLWHDQNRDGISQASELSRVDAYLQAIGLSYTRNARADVRGNLYAWQGWARRIQPGASPRSPRAKNQVVQDDATREFAIYDVLLAAR